MALGKNVALRCAFTSVSAGLCMPLGKPMFLNDFYCQICLTLVTKLEGEGVYWNHWTCMSRLYLENTI